MSMQISEMFGATKPRPLALEMHIPVTVSRTFTAPSSGWVTLYVMGAGGSGGLAAASLPASGGGSAGWSAKRIKVKAGDVIEITLGAGGAYPTALSSNGADGGTTTVKLNGVTIITVPGAGGGRFGATTATVVLGGLGGSLPTGGDINVAGSNAGTATSQFCSGGAGVDLYAQGGNATKSGDATTVNTVGAGIASPSVGAQRGGVQVNSSGLGPGNLEGAGEAWLVTFSTLPGGDSNTFPGYGGVSGSLAGFGGGSSSNASQGRQAGRGGGGGGASIMSQSQSGGDAYVALHFAAEEL